MKTHKPQQVLTHGSLFSGIGGFEEAAKRAEIKNVWYCEIDEWNRRLLNQNYDTKGYIDIRDMHYPEYVDIITGGFPCQDISVSGRGKGINGSRSGLWGEYWRIIREVKPKYVIIENSPALLIRGFEQVLCDLSKIGYMCEWRCLCADEFGADHKRERLYAIAYPMHIGLQGLLQRLEKNDRILPKTSSKIKWSVMPKSFDQLGDYKRIRSDDGVRHRAHRIKGLGNSIYVPIAEAIFEAILAVEHKLF